MALAPSYTVGQIDEMCIRINQLAMEAAGNSFGSGLEEQKVADIVRLVQEVGEGVAWAYQQNKRGDFGEQFAQPFVDRKMQNVLKGLLLGRWDGVENTNKLRKDLQNRIAVQVLQTFHILLQATPEDSLLFCSLTAGYNLNEVITAQYEFKDSEDLLFLWMTLIKDIARMLNEDNIMLFFDPSSENPFPIFSEAAKYYQHPASQVRTHVQAMSLDILSKLTHGGIRSDPLFTTIMCECRILCTHVCCLLREFWRMVDDCITSGSIFLDPHERLSDGKQPQASRDFEGAKRGMRNAMSIQNDILLYLGDLLSNDIPELTEMTLEKLLRVALLPVLLRCMLRRVGHVDASPSAKEVLSPGAAAFLLFDGLITLRGSCPAVVHVIARLLLEGQLPQQAQQVVCAMAPRTPAQFLRDRAKYSRQASSRNWDRSISEDVPEDDIYDMPADLLPCMLKRSTIQDASMVPNELLDALLGTLQGLVPDQPLSRPSDPRKQRELKPYGIGAWFLGVLALLLQTVHSDQDIFLTSEVMLRLGNALCIIIAGTARTPWLITDTALRCLRELARAGDKVPGRAHSILAPSIKKMLLRPCADCLDNDLQAARNSPGHIGKLHGDEHAQGKEDIKMLESWLNEFQEGWIGHMEARDSPASSAFPPRPTDRGGDSAGAGGGGAAGARARQLELTLSRSPDRPDAPQGNQRLWRVILGARSIFPTKPLPHIMPGVDNVELEELARYQCGVPVHVGNMHRLRCVITCPRLLKEPVFLLPAQATMVLVKPDKNEPFRAVPLVVEPLRLVRLVGADNTPVAPLEPVMPPGANHENSQKSLKFQILSPSSPCLQTLHHPPPAAKPAAAPTPGTVAAAAAVAERDRLANSLGSAGGQERHSTDDVGEIHEKKEKMMAVLTFSDPRRQRIGYKLFAQARHFRILQMVGLVDTFLDDCRQSEL